MTKTFDTRSGDHLFLLAAAIAVLAAIFMIAVWGPLQARALTSATEEQARAGTAATDSWTRVPFVTIDGATTSLAASNGQVRVVTMMYTHCPGVCPLAVATLQQMQNRLPSAQQNNLSIVALSLDPQHDSLSDLQEFSNARGISWQHWTVARPSVEGARQLADAMGVSYRLLGDDSVDHQSVFVLLGKSGQVLARTSSTRNIDPTFFSALQGAVNAN